MIKKNICFLFLSVVLLTSCGSLFERRHFGVRESVWNTLSEDSKQKAIEGYNEREARQQEIDAEMTRRQQEIDAQNAPYEYALKIAETMAENQNPCCINKVDTTFGRITLNNRDTYRVEDSNSIRNWGVGHYLIVHKHDRGFYDYTLENPVTRERVRAQLWNL